VKKNTTKKTIFIINGKNGRKKYEPLRSRGKRYSDLSDLTTKNFLLCALEVTFFNNKKIIMNMLLFEIIRGINDQSVNKLNRKKELNRITEIDHLLTMFELSNYKF